MMHLEQGKEQKQQSEVLHKNFSTKFEDSSKFNFMLLFKIQIVM